MINYFRSTISSKKLRQRRNELLKEKNQYRDKLKTLMTLGMVWMFLALMYVLFLASRVQPRTNGFVLLFNMVLLYPYIERFVRTGSRIEMLDACWGEISEADTLFSEWLDGTQVILTVSHKHAPSFDALIDQVANGHHHSGFVLGGVLLPADQFSPLVSVDWYRPLLEYAVNKGYSAVLFIEGGRVLKLETASMWSWEYPKHFVTNTVKGDA